MSIRFLCLFFICLSTKISEINMGKLKGIPDILSPDILYLLASSGHGDEIGECQNIIFAFLKAERL